MAFSPAMARESRHIWEKRVARLRDGDLTTAEFAAEIGVNVHTLRGWKWRLEHENKAEPSARARTKARRGKRRKPAVEFVELPSPIRVTSSIELIVDDVTVRVPRAFDAEDLRQVLTVLREAA